MFNDEEILAAAARLGLEIEMESDRPGFHFQDEDGSVVKSYTFEQLEGLSSPDIDYDNEINLKKSKDASFFSSFRNKITNPLKYSTGQGKEQNNQYYGYDVTLATPQETSGKTIKIDKAA